MSKSTRFSRVSTYLDAYVLGTDSEPHHHLVRVHESGYRKDTQKDKDIVFSEGRGKLMAAALGGEPPQLRLGRDEAWHIVVPIGEHVVVNLSDDIPREAHLAADDFEFVKNLAPYLITAGDKITAVAKSHITQKGINRLRNILPLGQTKMNIGCIFVEFSDYGEFLLQYGDEFRSLISEGLFPALITKLAHIAVPEFVHDHEIYFCIVAELQDDKLLRENLPMACLESLGILHSFFVETLPAFLANHGIAPCRLRAGVSFGEVTLNISSTTITSLGKPVNQAKRLQESARPGDILVNAELLERWPSSDIIHQSFTPSFRVLVKDMLLQARICISNPMAATEEVEYDEARRRVKKGGHSGVI